MAYADLNRSAVVGFPTRSLSTFFADISAWSQARQTRAALAKLSDHELEDIGLSRGDIDAVATGRIVR